MINWKSDKMKSKQCPRRGVLSCKGRFILLISLVLFISPLIAQESWPLSTDWKTLISSDWTPFSDPQDVSQGYIDFVIDDNGSCGYYWATSTSLFFRMVIRVNPINKKNEMTQNAWGIMLDVDKDNYLDWFILLGGVSSNLWAYPNAVEFPDNVEDGTENWIIVAPYEGVNVYVQHTAAPSTTYPDAYYYDIQVPFTALQMTGYDRNMNYNSTFKVVYGSNTSESLSNMADLTGISTTLGDAFAASATYTPSQPDSYGEVYDTRDTNPYSDAGIWYRNETVTVSGSGWPTSNSTYYNSGQHNVRIVDQSCTTIWSGSITTSTDGSFTSYSLWTIGTSVIPGMYTFQVEDPRETGTYKTYDSFEIQAPVISVSKTAGTSVIDPGDTVVYSIKINNDGNLTGNLTTITDDLPTGFSYIAGSSCGLTTSNPNINGSQLIWTDTWSVNALDSLNLDFSVKASLTPGSYSNNASISGSNFVTKSTGSTAEVQINGPTLTLSKSVDKSSASPGAFMCTFTSLSQM